MTDTEIRRTVWNANQAATFAGVSRRTIERHLKAGTLEATKNSSGGWEILPSAMTAAGFTLRTGPDDPVSNETATSTPSPALDFDKTVEELERLRRENNDLRRRAEVAEARADERGEAINGLREALSTIKALPPAPQNTETGRRRPWRIFDR